MPVVFATGVVITAIIGINFTFVNQPWLSIVNYTLLAIGPILLVAGLLSFLCKVKFRAPSAQKEVSQRPIIYNDKVADSVAWSAARPDVNGESKNCKVSTSSTETRLLFEPIFTLQYFAVILAGVLVAFLLSLGLSNSLPHIPYGTTLSSIEPTLKTFLCMFITVALVCIGYLLLKPVRSIEFNKDMGVFWIEKTRIFRWKAGQSAQMPLAQIYALQIISYTNREAYRDLKTQSLTQGHCAPGYTATNHHSAKEHEINVVFRSGERVNIINHRNFKAIRQDATALASFLDIPVWDRDSVGHTPLSDATPEITAAA